MEAEGEICCSELIHREILGRGPMSFARFVELALYAPGCGYYARGTARVGRRGDFTTAVSYGPAFGCLLARTVEEAVAGLGGPIWLVEQGAADGSLLADILAALEEGVRKSVVAAVVEPFPEVRRAQERRLQGMEVRWFSSVGELPCFDGLFYANELLDAFPFHLVEANAQGGWDELCVTIGADGFEFWRGAPGEAIRGAVAELPTRPAGFRLELRPAVAGWLRELRGRLGNGWVLAFDYGLSRDDLLDPARAGGTYCCFRSHRQDKEPLDDPGEKDITAHVDFTALEESARELGFRTQGPTDLGRFLVRSVAPWLREMEGRIDPGFASAFRMLVHPEGFGVRQRAVALASGSAQPLRGFLPAQFDLAKPLTLGQQGEPSE